MCIELSVGALANLTLALFYDCWAGLQGGAIFLQLTVHGVASLVFGTDLRSLRNMVIKEEEKEAADADSSSFTADTYAGTGEGTGGGGEEEERKTYYSNNIHLLLTSRLVFPCFSPLYELFMDLTFDSQLLTVSEQPAQSADMVTPSQTLGEVLEHCGSDRCSLLSVDSCMQVPTESNTQLQNNQRSLRH